ncbi:hypothetical protein OG381_22265 [Streptomyces sp. NBC_00490]|uniref:hypothetical protein n=1 Tax=Streptomyces sp. NBC_00490 TaxID=2903657 RepID=UPI002E181928
MLALREDIPPVPATAHRIAVLAGLAVPSSRLSGPAGSITSVSGSGNKSTVCPGPAGIAYPRSAPPSSDVAPASSGATSAHVRATRTLP